VSGHSTFSRAGAEYLTRFTGSSYFPGGLGEHVVPQGTGLAFEYGPSQEVRLQWATYFDAADEAGISRLWGGIHIDADDHHGRIAGSAIGICCYDLAVQYFDGIAKPHPPFEVTIGQAEGTGEITLNWPCIIGRTYQVEGSTNATAYTVSGIVTANTVGVTFTNPVPNKATLFRISTEID